MDAGPVDAGPPPPVMPTLEVGPEEVPGRLSVRWDSVGCEEPDAVELLAGEKSIAALPATPSGAEELPTSVLPGPGPQTSADLRLSVRVTCWDGRQGLAQYQDAGRRWRTDAVEVAPSSLQFQGVFRVERFNDGRVKRAQGCALNASSASRHVTLQADAAGLVAVKDSPSKLWCNAYTRTGREWTYTPGHGDGWGAEYVGPVVQSGFVPNWYSGNQRLVAKLLEARPGCGSTVCDYRDGVVLDHSGSMTKLGRQVYRTSTTGTWSWSTFHTYTPGLSGLVGELDLVSNDAAVLALALPPSVPPTVPGMRLEEWTLHESTRKTRWAGPTYARGDVNARLGDSIYRATQGPGGRVLERCPGRVSGPCVPMWTAPGEVRSMDVIGRWLYVTTEGNLPAQSGRWVFREGEDGSLVPAASPAIHPRGWGSYGYRVQVDVDSYLRFTVYEGSTPKSSIINEVAFQRLDGESWTVAGRNSALPAPVTGVGLDDGGRVWLAVNGYLLRVPQEVR